MATVNQTIDQINASAELGVAINLRCTPEEGWQGHMVSANGRVAVTGQAPKFEDLVEQLFDKLNAGVGIAGA